MNGCDIITLFNYMHIQVLRDGLWVRQETKDAYGKIMDTLITREQYNRVHLVVAEEKPPTIYLLGVHGLKSINDIYIDQYRREVPFELPRLESIKPFDYEMPLEPTPDPRTKFGAAKYTPRDNGYKTSKHQCKRKKKRK